MDPILAFCFSSTGSRRGFSDLVYTDCPLVPLWRKKLLSAHPQTYHCGDSSQGWPQTHDPPLSLVNTGVSSGLLQPL